MQKYARIFVLEAHNIPRAKLFENYSLLGTDTVSADKRPSIFSRRMEDSGFAAVRPKQQVDVNRFQAF